jgi:hypothetical protein
MANHSINPSLKLQDKYWVGNYMPFAYVQQIKQLHLNSLRHAIRVLDPGSGIGLAVGTGGASVTVPGSVLN